MPIEVSSSVLLSQIVNWFVLLIIIIIAFWLGRNARKKGLPWSTVIAWSALTLFICPVGLGLSFLMGKRDSKKKTI
jgi:hypothetical protein